MPAFWADEAKHGWRMAYSGDDPQRAEQVADKLRKDGKETKIMRHMTKSLAMRSYMEYVTLYRNEDGSAPDDPVR